MKKTRKSLRKGSKLCVSTKKKRGRRDFGGRMRSWINRKKSVRIVSRWSE